VQLTKSSQENRAMARVRTYAIGASNSVAGCATTTLAAIQRAASAVLGTSAQSRGPRHRCGPRAARE
jgi:hypothetical protein